MTTRIADQPKVVAKWIWIGVMIAIAIITLSSIGGFFWLRSQKIQIEEITMLQWRDLKSSEAILKKAKVPSGWLAGFYVSNEAIAKSLAIQTGTILTIKGQEGFEDLTVDIKGLELVSQNGPPIVNVNLLATSKKNNLQVALKGKALLGYKKTDIVGETKKVSAFLRLTVIELIPELSWSGISMALPAFMKNIAASGAMKSLGENLEFPIPLSESLKISFGEPPSETRGPTVTKTEVIPIQETGGSVTLAATYLNTDLTLPINFSVPLFTKSGIWLLASATPVPVPEITNAAPTVQDLKTLAASVNEIRNDITTPKDDVSVFLSQNVLLAFFNQFSALPLANRTITIASTAYDKQLYNKPWSDDVLGKGGFYVEARKPNFVNATVVIDAPNVTWVPSIGLNIVSTVSAQATTDLHWHFDPTLGGGVGADLNIKSSGAIPINGMIGLSMIDLEGQKIAAFTPVMQCVNVPIQGSENGELKIALKTGQLMFDKPIAPMPVLDMMPVKVELPKPKEMKPGEPEPKGIYTTTAWANKEFFVSLAPTEASVTNDGFWMAAKYDVTKDEPDFKNLRENFSRLLSAYTAKMPVPPCPKPEGMAISIRGVELGQNGELIKLFKVGGALVNQVTKEAQKVLDATVSVGKGAVKVLKDICGDWCP